MTKGDEKFSQPLHPGMGILLLVASGLVFFAGIQLFVFASATEKYFAWTITPTFTAAFLGANYWASCILEFSASRRHTWAEARIAVPGVLLFTTLTLIVTVQNISSPYFHQNFFGYVWLIVYAVVPPAMAILLYLQTKVEGSDPPRALPLPLGIKIPLALQTALLAGMGAILWFAPRRGVEFLPWEASYTDGAYLAAWFLGIGVVIGQMLWEDDYIRITPAAKGLVGLGLFHFLALIFFGNQIFWNSPGAWVYILFLLSILGVGGYCIFKSFRRGGEFSSIST